MQQKTIQNKDLLRQLMKIALPVALQSMLGFFVNLLDTVMLGRLGEVQISAASLSNQIFFILSLLIYGIVGGSNVMVAQFWGKGDKKSINRVLAYTYRIALLAAVVLMLLGLLLPTQTMSFFSGDKQVISEGTSYLRIVSISYVFYAFTSVTTGTLRSVRNVRISVILSAVSLIINGMFNYILIFGKFGVPAMGITGAAIATLIARVVEAALLVFYMAFYEDQLHIRPGSLLNLSHAILKPYFSNTMPVILNELFWSVGSSVLAVIMGRMGTEFVAANSIFSVTGQLASVLAQGLNAAGAVMIGNAIGAN